MRTVLFKIIVVVFITAAQSCSSQKYIDYVNPFIGASTSTEKAESYHGLGKTFPGATTPFGMVQVNPNTIFGGDNGSGYSYEHESIEGFALTQMSGVGWFGDFGNFLITPTSGPLQVVAGPLDNPDAGYRSRFSKQTEQASAGYYRVHLTDHNILAEMTATAHCGMLQFTYNEAGNARIQIDLAHRVGGTSTRQYFKVINDHTFEGWIKCGPEGGGWGNGDGKVSYTLYFYAQTDQALTSVGGWTAEIPSTWSRRREDIESGRYQKKIAEAKIVHGAHELEGDHIGFYSAFQNRDGEKVRLKVGISFASLQGAKRNLEAEIPHWNFEKVKEEASTAWEKELSKITIEGGSEEERTVFYTALYHTMIDPRLWADVDSVYVGGDGQPHRGKAFVKRTVFSGWDVFRAQFPLQTIINPGVVNDMLNSLIELGDQSGQEYLERWELSNSYSGCMYGNPAVSVLTDAYMKGIRNYNVDKGFQYAINTCEKFGTGEKGFVGDGIGLSKTLEYAYSEWCLAQLASALNKPDIAAKYQHRSYSYKNVFDDSTNWFRPRLEDGRWAPWPAEGRLKQWYGCMESNPYQQGWFVPHDIPGLVTLVGDQNKTRQELELFFEKAPTTMLWNDYYNHANEPVHHAAFLFNRLKAPWLTQKWSRLICKRAYHNAVEGLVGNEDAGQMSAWYVLAASGLYPVCPGNPSYEITSPVFSKITFQLDQRYATGKTFTVIAHNNSPDNMYIQRAVLNGEPFNKTAILHQDIATGGTLELFMGREPKPSWGSDDF